MHTCAASKNEILLILTATLSPPQGVTNLSRLDKEERFQDYYSSLSFYLECLQNNVISKLVFIDNSASDLTKLQNLANEYNVDTQVEFISFYGLDYPPNYGRGYGEFKLIDYANDHSTLITSLAEDGIIWKITGRYIVRNIGQLIHSRPQNVNLYCNYRNYPTRWLDLYILAWNKKLYNSILKGAYHHLNEDKSELSSEQLFRNHIDTLDRTIKIGKRFFVEPELEGIRGWDNKRYEDMKIKFLIRKILRALFPWFWI